MNRFDQSKKRLANFAKYLPGGVNSNFRMGISPTPLVFERAEGPYLYDVDGNQLIDYYLGMGPIILGHNPEPGPQSGGRAAQIRNPICWSE